MRRCLLPAVILVAMLIASPALADAGAKADEVRVFDWIRTFWPIALVLGGMIIAGVMAGLGLRFVGVGVFNSLRDRVEAVESSLQAHALRLSAVGRVEAVESGLQAHALRLSAVELAMDSSPTRGELQEDISELSQRMASVETGIKGIDGRLETSNTYLNMLLERGMRGAA